MNKGIRTGELNQKGVVYTTAAIEPNGGALSAGTDKLVKTIEYDTEGSGSVSKELETDATLGQICLSNSGRTLFACVTDNGVPGSLRVYSYPVTGHFYPCSGQLSTPDDMSLFGEQEVTNNTAKEYDRTYPSLSSYRYHIESLDDIYFAKHFNLDLYIQKAFKDLGKDELVALLSAL